MDSKQKRLLVSIHILLMVISQPVGQYSLFCEGVRSYQKHSIPTYGGNPPVKTIKHSNGDVVDCVDFYDQPAFEHPLLKDQKIKAKLALKRENPAPSAGGAVDHNQVQPNTEIICPHGTVPILRQAMERTLNSTFGGSLKHVFSSFDSPTARTEEIAGLVAQHAVFWGEDRNITSISASINVWNPFIGDDDASSVYIAAGSGNNGGGFAVGWLVNLARYGDKKTRLFVSWSANQGTAGCDNLLCPGFVQVSTRNYLGMELLPISIYAGPNHEESFALDQHQGSADWWVTFGKEHIGYFPASLVPALTGQLGTTRAVLGGALQINTRTSERHEMGSGHFAEEGYSKACYIKDIQLHGAEFNGETEASVLLASVIAPRCNSVKDLGKMDFGGGPTPIFTLGGPGCKPYSTRPM